MIFFNFAVMNYPLFLARKLSLGHGSKKMSPAVTVAIIAITISVIVMTASIAIVLGFKKEIRDKVVGFNGHISLYKIPVSEEDSNLITITPFIKDLLDSLSFVKDYNITASIPAILKTSDDFKGVYLRGLAGKNAIEYLGKNLEEGEIPDYTNPDTKQQIIISRIASNQLKLSVGDKIETYFITDDIRVRKLEIVGIYNSHFDQYDDVIVFGGMKLVAQLGNLDNDTGINIVIDTDDFDNILGNTFELQEQLNKAVAYGGIKEFYHTDNVLNQGRGFFSWLNLLDTNVIVIIILMMIVGCVTLVSGILIIILERKKFIGLMRALGASTVKIRNVFIYMAIKIAFIGILIGDVIVLVFLYFQHRYHFIPLDPDAYYINFVPVFLPWWIVLILNFGILIVTYLVLVLPSRFVGKISPSESMIKVD